MIFVGHPIDENKEREILELVMQLISLSASKGEQRGCDDDGIRVGLIPREILNFKDRAGNQQMSSEVIQLYLYEAPTRPNPIPATT